jgi:hypothetical protein
VRVSTDKQADHGVSLEAQEAKIRAMATRAGGESAKNRQAQFATLDLRASPSTSAILAAYNCLQVQMSAKTVFISSTYKDLKDHRREVWNTLKRFEVAVRGMEEFGARTTGPLETCLAEVEQSDVYVGIVAYRLGSIDPATKKPFTVLEYESAVEQEKEILIYIADDEATFFPRSVMDDDTGIRKRLTAFKDKPARTSDG